MHAHQALIDRFYVAFAARDHATMAASYDAEARFSDPVFPELRGARIGAMWRMLCERGTDLAITHTPPLLQGEDVTTHWDARYTFSQTGRLVNNAIDARFQFRDGLIVDHRDVFDLSKWTRMALGPIGLLLGWTPIIQNKVRKNAGAALEAFAKKRGL